MTAIGRISTLALLVAAFGIVLGAGPALAQPEPPPGDGGKEAPAPPPPTPEQMEQAKQAFLAGKALFDEKKFEEAVEKFKESYRLSRNAMLLYNVAFTLDQMSQKDLAVFYYKKFLSDAPADAAQRPDATARLKVLEKELAAVVPPDGGGGDVTPPDGGGGGGGKVRRPKVDPASYTAEDFQHQVVEDAPPGKPLDLTAFSPEDSGWLVTMYYRGPGEAKFTSVQMRPRYNELVARVPSSMMKGVSIQYYIEVRTPDAKIVTRVGKPSSPNIVYIDEKARPRYYPDLTDERDWDPDTGGGGGGGGGGFVAGGWTDVGSTKFKRGKWIATGGAIGLMSISVTFYLLAANMSSSLEAEASISRDNDECTPPDTVPCKSFNDDRKAIETAGKRNELVNRLSFGLGLGATGVAAWFWYKELKAIKAAERGKAAAAPASGLRSIVAIPVVGDDFVGGSAALRF